jgi:CBS domain-containing protein
MKIGEMCTRGAVYVPQSATLRDAATLMMNGRVGSVVVVEKSTAKPVPIGIVTDRDIVRAQLEHVADLSRLRVADVMTKAPLVLNSDERLEHAIELMRARGVRRAPVISALGALIGFVSTDDLIAEVARQLGVLARLVHRQPEEALYHI